MVAELERIDTTIQGTTNTIGERPSIDPNTSPPWWFRFPTLIVNSNLHIIDQGRKTNHTEAAQVFDAARPMLETIAREFERAGCSTITVSHNEEVPITTNGSHDNPAYSITINPVYLGSLPKQVEIALADYRLHPDDPRLLKALKKYLPEEKTPLLAGIGNRLLRILQRRKDPEEKKQESEKNFVNMIFIRDDNGAIAAAPDRAKQLFNWTLMAKVGAFKETITAFKEAGGEIEFSNHILATLEGGHPFLESIDLAQHLMVVGSTKSVGSAEVIENVDPISRRLWRNSPVVNGLRELGKFLGRRDLLSPPLAFHQMVRSRLLQRKLKKIAKFARQAEGAFWGFYPKQKMVESATALMDPPLTGVAIVTSSGKFGAIKTKLGFKDIVTSIPARKKHPTDESKIVYLPVQGQEVRKPSVEAEEFTWPVYELASENPETYTVRLQETKDGYIKSSEGDITAPVVKGVAHLHDKAIIKEGVDDIFEVDTSEFPAFGCGVDLMQEMSRRVMKKAIDTWIKRGRKDKAAIFYVPNHGYNIMTFWKEDKNGIIPEDPFALLKEAVEKGELIITREVPQRHYYRPLDDYYAKTA
ncbi:hypothetical protein HY383_03575 [Candidatus Daviesbacteria bacterium]|nr:hypothetical protein [Candidatus Daviesbacteria bacterium]